MSEAAAYPKVRIRYMGPPGSHTVAGLATRTKYGRHEYGDVFWVHRADAVADPEAYDILDDSEGVSVADALPKTPDDLRMPEMSPIGDIPKQPDAFPVDLPPSLDGLEIPEPETAEADVQPRTENAPAEIATLVDLGIDETVAASAAQIGLFTVADVVAYIEANGESALKNIKGVGKKNAGDIAAQLTAHGYLTADPDSGAKDEEIEPRTGAQPAPALPPVGTDSELQFPIRGQRRDGVE